MFTYTFDDVDAILRRSEMKKFEFLQHCRQPIELEVNDNPPNGSRNSIKRHFNFRENFHLWRY